MMDSFTHFLRNGLCKPALWREFFLVLCLFASQAGAQTLTEITQFRAERLDESIAVSAQVQFELPAAVEEALLKGIPLFFVTDADLLRERWYWYDKKVAAVSRNMRLAYQPLTRRWRLNVSDGASPSSGQGLALNQSFDALPQALDAIKRVSRWRLAEVTELDPSVKYKIDFRFRLDLGQLPRPFQIGTLGQSEWDIASSITAPLSNELLK